MGCIASLETRVSEMSQMDSAIVLNLEKCSVIYWKIPLVLICILVNIQTVLIL